MRIFVTGASGWIGSAVVPELLEAGHEVVGLARSDASAGALEAAGAEVHRGSLDDRDALGRAATASDGVVHLAFEHEEAFSGDFATATDADRRAIEAFGEALAGSDRPLVIASGLAGLQPGELATEDDVPDAASPAGGRTLSERAALALADRGVRSSSVRLPPTVHGDGDNGFVASLVGMAHGASGHVGDSANHWPAVHRLDAARLFRLAVEGAPAGSVLHGVAEEGVPTRAIAEVIGRGLGLPAVSVAPAAPRSTSGGSPASSASTCRRPALAHRSCSSGSRCTRVSSRTWTRATTSAEADRLGGHRRGLVARRGVVLPVEVRVAMTAAGAGAPHDVRSSVVWASATSVAS